MCIVHGVGSVRHVGGAVCVINLFISYICTCSFVYIMSIAPYSVAASLAHMHTLYSRVRVCLLMYECLLSIYVLPSSAQLSPVQQAEEKEEE